MIIFSLLCPWRVVWSFLEALNTQTVSNCIIHNIALEKRIVFQMALLEDIAFHSSIPVPLDITVAVVYSVFGE